MDFKKKSKKLVNQACCIDVHLITLIKIYELSLCLDLYLNQPNYIIWILGVPDLKPDDII